MRHFTFLCYFLNIIHPMQTYIGSFQLRRSSLTSSTAQCFQSSSCSSSSSQASGLLRGLGNFFFFFYFLITLLVLKWLCHYTSCMFLTVFWNWLMICLYFGSCVPPDLYLSPNSELLVNADFWDSLLSSQLLHLTCIFELYLASQSSFSSLSQIKS